MRLPYQSLHEIQSKCRLLFVTKNMYSIILKNSWSWYQSTTWEKNMRSPILYWTWHTSQPFHWGPRALQLPSWTDDTALALITGGHLHCQGKNRLFKVGFIVSSVCMSWVYARIEYYGELHQTWFFGSYKVSRYVPGNRLHQSRIAGF